MGNLKNGSNYEHSNLVQLFSTDQSNHSLSLNHHRPRITSFKIPNYKIEHIKPVGSNQVLSDYLSLRGIWDIGNQMMREIYYYLEDEKKIKKHFFALGWQNEEHGWEVRNKYFNGCLGSRAVTYIPINPVCLVVFSCMLNFLTWKRYFPGSTHSVLIINSMDCLDRAIQLARNYMQIQLFINQNRSGIEATQAIIAAAPYAKDQSSAFKGYMQYNEKLTAELRAFQLLDRKPVSGKSK